MDASGNYNFPGVKWEWRPGSLEQSHIPGIPSVDNEITQGIELRSDKPWVRALDDTRLSAVRLRFAWPALQSMDSAGNVNGYRIEYAVDVATDGGAYVEVLKDAVHGKSTSTYERTRRIDLPKADTGWSLRVRRLTANQNTNKIADTMQIAGLTEVIDAKLRYPNTALLYIEFSAEQFRNIPAVTVECKGRKWPVPSNYDPETRTYQGIWDGTFKQAWTDNPAWVTYGITTNDRFGLGRRIKPWMVDKWELYRIAQYCDQLVPDGKGGQEPRFTCNLNLQGKAEAWSLLRDIAGIYRGMTYWAQGQLYSLADMPRATDFDFAYTRANVVDGKFSYSSGSERSRYSRALVSYDNPLNNYDTDVTVVADDKLLRRYGDNPLELSAIGCTRESEAQRRGKWALLTNARDRGISFRVGMDGRIPLPGYVIPVADELLAGRPVGGRIAAVSGRQVTLDRDTQAKAGDRLILNLPDGTCEARTVEAVDGRRLTVTTAYSSKPRVELVWALDAADLAIPLYRVTSVSRAEPGTYEINAVQYDPGKFAHIDTGARLEERPISVTPINLVPPPASITLSSSHAVSQGLAVSTLTIAWPAVSGAVAYEVEWRKDDGNWISLPRTGACGVDVTGIYAGAYLARVRSVSASEISSVWKVSQLTPLTGKEGAPPAVAQLQARSKVFGIGLDWSFPEGAGDTQRTEIWYGTSTSRAEARKLGDFAYPQAEHELQGLAAGTTFFFWARLVDRSGNIGNWYPADVGVHGQASVEQSEYDRYFTGKISESALGKHLFERIQLIDGSGEGSVDQRLQALDGQLQARLEEVARLSYALEYDSAASYAPGDSVRFARHLYQAIANVPQGTPPPNATFWLDIGQVVRDSQGLAARVSTSETRLGSVEGVNTAQSSRLDGLQASLNGKADATALSTLSSQVTDAQGKLASNSAALTSLSNSLTDVKGATEAQASAISSLDSRVRQVDGRLISEASRIDGIFAQINPPMAGGSELAGDTRSYVGVWSEQSARIEDGLALGRRVDTVVARQNTTDSLVNSISQAQVGNSNGIAALANRLDTVQVRVDGTSASVQQLSQAQARTDNKLATQWSVKMQVTADGRYYAAGVSLGIEDRQSQFLVSADNFAVVGSQAGGEALTPFSVQNGQVFMRSTFIQDGTISSAKIGNSIQSNALSEKGSPIWQLDKSGTFTIRDNKGNVRVQMGILV